MFYLIYEMVKTGFFICVEVNEPDNRGFFPVGKETVIVVGEYLEEETVDLLLVGTASFVDTVEAFVGLFVKAYYEDRLNDGRCKVIIELLIQSELFGTRRRAE